MTEDFLHYLWKYRLIEPNQPLTSGEPVSILNPGMLNKDSGPDFFNARIRIGDTLWAGNVEIHVQASDWSRHHHFLDPAYDNVILHVVLQNDCQVFRKNGEAIPTLELSGKINPGLHAVYQQLMMNRNWVPCAHLLPYAGRLVLHNWLDRMLAERFDRKALDVQNNLVRNGNDWNETFYQALARNFGFHVNAVPFELLAKSLPLSILRKHIDHLPQLEALLFGQAGMLSVSYRSQYFINLKREYKFLSAKYGLVPIDVHLWKFMRMRPSNFPTLRIAEFAGLMHHSSFLFSRILETDSIGELKRIFQTSASAFWDSHYSFKARSPKSTKKLGSHGMNLVFINTLVPFLYLYGKVKNQPLLVERALTFLDQLPAESNAVISGWKALGVSGRSAYNTQALIELKGRYCERKRCLECAIGNSVLKGVAGGQQAEKK